MLTQRCIQWQTRTSTTKLPSRVAAVVSARHARRGNTVGPDTPGLSDTGIDGFSAAYEDWKQAEHWQSQFDDSPHPLSVGSDSR